MDLGLQYPLYTADHIGHKHRPWAATYIKYPKPHWALTWTLGCNIHYIPQTTLGIIMDLGLQHMLYTSNNIGH